MRVLIAEDDPVARMRLEKTLRYLGHWCQATVDGREALAAVAADAFDVLITDREMPHLDGLGLVRAARALEREEYLYVIVLTALGDRRSQIEGMEAGADEYLAKPLDIDVLHARLLAAERITDLHHRLHDQKRELARLNTELYETSRVDPLTGVGNRLRLIEDLEGHLSAAERHGRRLCLAIMDVDFFKKYNDTAGHQAGDAALRTVAGALREACRRSDAVYRYGGEEFVVVLPDTDLEDGCHAAERLRRAVVEASCPHPGLGHDAVVTISCGVACSDHANTTDALLVTADRGLYEAKQSGRNCVRAALATPA